MVNNAQHGSSDEAKPKELSADEKHILGASGEVPNDPFEGQISHRVQYVDSAGNVGEKVHGPMPRSEWAEYARKNNL